MKMMHFVDTAGSDENFFPAENCNQVSVTAATTVIIRFSNSGDEADHLVTLTTTSGKSDEVALRLAQEIGASQIQYGGVLKVIADTAPFADVGTVAYTAGS
tara:strand:+ start:69 stop:371 length:303 start_codon:yes stop_codon:yes gene_type:complete